MTTAALALVAALAAAGEPEPRIATGTAGGQAVAAAVDAEIARYYLESYLGDGPTDPSRHRRIDEALAGADPADRETLERLTGRLSADFATLFFVDALYRRPMNRRARERYEAELTALREGRRSRAAIPERYFRYLFVFVPGYGYRKNPEVGADFGRQRRAMGRLGFESILIEIDESGSVEANAAMVERELLRLAGSGRPIVVVSTSKGGAEAALALGGPAVTATGAVRAWISVGGLLRGSPYADHALARRGWARLLSRTLMLFRGLPQEVVASLGTERRRRAFESLRFPESLRIVHFVGAPLASQVGESVRRRYEILRPLGPNDGLTLLADELVEGGRVITELGLDHYYRDPDLDSKAIALLLAVLGELEPAS